MLRRDTAGIPQAALITPMSKSMLYAHVMEQPSLCLMSVLSHCGVVLDPNSTDLRQHGRRGVCANDYQIQRDMVADGIVTWEEIEATGLCRPNRRNVSKRLLSAVLTIRK